MPPQLGAEDVGATEHTHSRLSDECKGGIKIFSLLISKKTSCKRPWGCRAYVFNYRASYAEETDAVVRYLVKIRGVRPEQIAVFAQQDAYGDSGFAGVAKAMRAPPWRRRACDLASRL